MKDKDLNILQVIVAMTIFFGFIPLFFGTLAPTICISTGFILGYLVGMERDSLKSIFGTPENLKQIINEIEKDRNKPRPDYGDKEMIDKVVQNILEDMKKDKLAFQLSHEQSIKKLIQELKK